MGIVRVLMSIQHPSPEVIAAVEGAVAWFKAAQLNGIRALELPDAESPTGTNVVVEMDSTAPPLWARFYEIGTNRPIYADRDGLIRYNIADIGYERRNGYRWLGNWPQKLLDKDYPAWRRKVSG